MAIKHSQYQDIHKHHSLIDKVWSMDNLVQAWKRVRANKGAPGIDGMSIKAFERDLGKHLSAIQRQLRENRYNPKPVQRVYIPKKSGKKLRPLGIPTIKDRIVQQALKQILEPIFEPVFLPQSFGYRPRRSALGAVERVRRYIQIYGYRGVADMDIKGFFDNVDHEILLRLVNEKVSDGRVLGLIRLFLESGVMVDGNLSTTDLGTPQGGVISPLLANIYLHHLDRRLVDRDVVFTRYADDIVILSDNLPGARRDLKLAKKILEEDLKLSLSEEKTSVSRVVKSHGVDYLGYCITLDCVKPSHTSFKRFKDNVRFRTRRQQGRKVETVIRRLNPVIRGWGNYFRKSTIKMRFWDLDKWIQQRIRGYLKERWWYTDIKRIPSEEILKMGLLTLESVMKIPRSLEWRYFRA
jgi:RNA-directed DNA polymerase